MKSISDNTFHFLIIVLWYFATFQEVEFIAEINVNQLDERGQVQKWHSRSINECNKNQSQNLFQDFM